MAPSMTRTRNQSPADSPRRYQFSPATSVRKLAFLSLAAYFCLGHSQTELKANNHWPLGRNQTNSLVVVPTSSVVVLTPAYVPASLPVLTTSFVLSPTVDIMPTTWITSGFPCGDSGLVSPALQPSRIPELSEIQESKPESAPETKPSENLQQGSKPEQEPKLEDMGGKPKSSDSVKNVLPPSDIPATVPMNTPVLNEKPPVQDDQPGLKNEPPLPLPGSGNQPSGKPAIAPASPPAASDPLPLPESVPPIVNEPPGLKPADLPPGKPSDDTLVPPPATEIPLPSTEIPSLESLPDKTKSVSPTSTSSVDPPAEKPPVNEAIPANVGIDLPPPVDAKLPDKPSPASKSDLPKIPLPDIPPPADDLTPLPPLTDSNRLQPVPELTEKPAGKPVDSNAVKASGEKPSSESETKRDSFRPVITETSKTAETTPKLNLSVRSQISNSTEKGVGVLFREPGSNRIQFRTETGNDGLASLEIPQGTWEVLVEMPNGSLYVLGGLISNEGKITTLSGKPLPLLEINR